MRKTIELSLLFFLVQLSIKPHCSFASALEKNETWSDVVTIDEDLLVPEGVKLTILPGTRILFSPAQSTRTDPSFFNPANEIAVNGEIEALGTQAQPIIFDGPMEWGGIYAAPGARATLANIKIMNASEGFACIGADCELTNAAIVEGDYGMVLGPGAKLKTQAVSIADCRIGIYDAREAPSMPEGVSLERIEDAPYLKNNSVEKEVSVIDLDFQRPRRGKKIEHIGEYTVEMDETWEGDIVFSGRVTVAYGAVVTILPGTRISFRKRDSNNDGLGEGELLVLGGIRSLGTFENPVIFDSAENNPQPGDWDKLSLIDSEDPYNVFKYTIFRHGVQVFHAHFAMFTLSNCLFEKNLRAVQFQDCSKAKIENSVFINNRQGLRFRDSKVEAIGNIFFSNLYGVHAHRCELDFIGNVIDASALGGFLSKESRVRFLNNRLANSRDGARMKGEGSWTSIEGNSFENFAEDALSLSFVEGEAKDNMFSDSGLDLASLEDSNMAFRNNIFNNAGRHYLHLKGETDVEAGGNYWSELDPSAKIYDKNDDPNLGKASLQPILKKVPKVEFVLQKTW